VPDIRTILVPFHDGLPDVAMGAGPRVLIEDIGGDAASVPPVETARPEVARSIELDRRLADLVAETVEDGAFPLVLAGACNSALGTVAGVGGPPIGVVWLDSHADFDTAEDNVSGFFDVMALSMLTGSAWQAQRASIRGLRPVPEDHVVLAALRDLAPYQRERAERSAMRLVPGAFAIEDLAEALDGLREGVARAYLHLDLDALDVGEGRANEYASGGGPSLATLLDAVDAVFDRFDVAAAALTAYDPAVDGDGRARAAAGSLLARIAERARVG